MQKLTLELLSEPFAVCKFDAQQDFPTWVEQSSFYTVTRSDGEMSVVCEERLVPENTPVSNSWRAFRVKGFLDFSLTGILSGMANPLAAAEISIFAMSTFDTDYVMVKEDTLESAIDILSKSGYQIEA